MRRSFVLVVVILILSIVINIYLFSKRNIAGEIIKSEERFQNDVQTYQFLSPRIFRETHPDFIFNFLDLRAALHLKLDPLGDDFGMYFEYLPNGTSININAGNEFIAASLFKLPVVMAYYRHKERAGEKDRKVKLTKEMLDNRFGDLWMKGEGYEISLNEAARMALVKSDNTAAEALGAVITQQDFDDVYEGLDIDLQIASSGAVMTARNYSSILKSLYYSAVLTKEDSEEILNYLTQSEFNDKLVAGIPSGVTVAHKIGVIDGASYRDCGIVYVPSRVYILCMISQGTEQQARDRMSSVSKMVYDYVSSAKSLRPTGKY